MFRGIRVMTAGVLALGVMSVASAQTSTTPAAQAAKPNPVYFGGGLSSNSISGWDSAMGMQLFGGYSFGQVANNVQVDAEMGYMDTGNMKAVSCLPAGLGGGCFNATAKAKGLWANGVARLALTSNVELIARAGLDFGDDDGFMVGLGAGYALNRQSSIRLEYVARQNVNSLQVNFVYRP